MAQEAGEGQKLKLVKPESAVPSRGIKADALKGNFYLKLYDSREESHRHKVLSL